MCKLCAQDKESNETRRKAFEVSAKLSHGQQIADQVIFVNTLKNIGVADSKSKFLKWTNRSNGHCNPLSPVCLFRADWLV
jgi:hypothetical protein